MENYFYNFSVLISLIFNPLKFLNHYVVFYKLEYRSGDF